MKVAGLYSGIGGLELGFERASHNVTPLCEIDPLCRQILSIRFDAKNIEPDIADLRKLPKVDAIVAGFPCQPYSQVGTRRGIRDGRVHIDHIVRLLKSRSRLTEFVVLENVPFIARLQRGRALGYLLTQFEELGYSWAYRILDTQGFGLPQRRRRLFFVASRDEDAATILFGGDRRGDLSDEEPKAHGFYWTEGNRGVGWANDAIPPLKCGSTYGFPSPPAIWCRNSGSIFTPTICDAERLQGFPAGWTEIDQDGVSIGDRPRWRFLGNAVSVNMAQWIANRLTSSRHCVPTSDRLLASSRFPNAAFGSRGRRFTVTASEKPSRHQTPGILEFLEEPGNPLSVGATRGFRLRLEASSLVKNAAFISALKAHEQAWA
ncbi:MAG: DNA cytosine methyltransferase [Candidatus Eremiobacteraeota bacterium]|nr:DNA cytosine methyltransferase [Candidatus Eremiobacteraeota bacterium]